MPGQQLLFAGVLFAIVRNLERQPMWRYRAITVSFALLLAAIRPAISAQIGLKAPEFRLPDTTGKMHSLSDYSGRIVIIAFWSFKCPVSQIYDERLREIQSKYGVRGVDILAVDSNSNESKAEIQRNAANLRLTYPVLVDEDGELADHLQASITPSYYVIDSQGVVRYQGALDNGKKPGDGARVPYLAQALDDLLSNRSIATPESTLSGCAIRRRTL